MDTFNSIEDLEGYNQNALENSPIGSLNTITNEVIPSNGSYWERITKESRPHEVFRLDWPSYTSLEWGQEAFLPYAKGMNGKALWMYDGAELFKELKTAESKQFKFDGHKNFISLVNYTYPKGVLAENSKSLTQPTDHEVLTFIEVDQDKNIDIHFKFGKRFKEYLKNTDSSLNTNELENKVYKTDNNTLNSFFNNELVHYKMMQYILKTIGLSEKANNLANYNKLFSSEVISFMENFSIIDKYKITVFIEKSQYDVYRKVEEPEKGKKAIFPDSNEIHIWLVSEDYTNYDTSFIKIQLGTNVAKDLKERNTTLDFIEQLVLDQIKAEIDFNIFSKKTVDKGVTKGLSSAMVRLWILEKTSESQLNKEVFETNPALFLSLEASSFVIEKIENKKLKEHNWNPKADNFTPLLPGSTLDNAFYCGLINGIIDEVKAIPEMIQLFAKISGSKKEYDEFIKGINKLLDEGIIKTLIEGATKEYKDALKEGNIEKLYYNFAHDLIQIVSLLIGLFQLAKGVASFINFAKKALFYLKRFGRKSLDDLKNFNKIEIKEIFDDLEIDQKVKAKKSAQFKQFVKKWKGKNISKLTLKEISDNLKGFTEQANRIAKLIDEGKMLVEILDDVDFEKILLKYGDTIEEARATQAFNIGERNYFRGSKPIDEFISEIVHEGTHTLDHINGFEGTVHQIEKRAFFHERAFQKVVDVNVDFEQIDDLLDFIEFNY